MKKNTFLLDKLYFYLAEGCNLRCRHCWIAPKYQTKSDSCSYLSLELFRSIISQAKPLGLSRVKLTGGEPLLHPQINEILKEIQVNELQLIVETNGVLCTEGMARELAACKNPSVSVSLDGANAETHEWMRGVSGCFEAAKEGIRNLVKAGLRPQVIMTIMSRNKDQIEDILHLVESLGCGTVKFNILQPAARGEEMHTAGQALSIEELVELGKWLNRVISPLTKPRLYSSFPFAFRPLSQIFGNNGDGCGTCGILGILGVLADGSYALCGIGETVPELVFGHAAKNSLEDIWHNTPVLQELREGLPDRLEGVCKQCFMRVHCLGSCIAQNYYQSKSLWAPFWFCEEASRRGLFPETRLQPKAKVYDKEG
jgi:SynChlorMet cassette radical SAM/SPASM protein ScmF